MSVIRETKISLIGGDRGKQYLKFRRAGYGALEAWRKAGIVLEVMRAFK